MSRVSDPLVAVPAEEGCGLLWWRLPAPGGSEPKVTGWLVMHSLDDPRSKGEIL